MKGPVTHILACASCCILFFLSCNEEQAPQTLRKPEKKASTKKVVIDDTPKTAVSYYFISLRTKDKHVRDSLLAMLKGLSLAERNVVLRLNRVDAASYRRLDTMIMPDKIDTNRMAYSIYPPVLPELKDVHKMVIFAYYPQAFAVYEAGKLIRWGPTNMGKKATPTPTGLFSANWKALETVSTVDDDWILKWNFNVSNAGGVGWHQYQLPGYPASHSCMRLMEADARWLYDWADMWIVRNKALAAQGTPVLIFGQYPFGKPKPWWGLVQNPSALNISVDTLNALLRPNLDKILARQARRDSVVAMMPKKEEPADTIVRAAVNP